MVRRMNESKMDGWVDDETESSRWMDGWVDGETDE